MDDLELSEYQELKAVVKAKGFMGLGSQEKRNRYKELNDKYKSTEEKVPLSKADIQAMLDEAVDRYKKETEKEYKDSGMAEVKKFGQWMKRKQDKPQNKTAKMRLYRKDGTEDAGLVVDLKFKKMGQNEITRLFNEPIYEISVLYPTGVEKVEMRLVDFSEINEFETVEIVEQKEEPQVLIQGQGRTAFTNAGYHFSSPAYFGTKQQKDPGETFDFEVTRRDVLCTIKRADGKTLTLHSSKLNL